MENKRQKRIKRKARIRAKIRGTKDVPRFSVFKSNKYIYAQLIDDVKGETLVGVSEKQIDQGASKKTNRSKELGEMIAKLAAKKKIKKVVFDRGGYLYHGRIKAVAEGAREGGLEF